MKGRNAHGKKENKTQLQRQSVSDDIPGEEGAFKPLQCHQSSWNPNMPLRGLIYINMVYQGYIAQHHLDLYSSTLLKLPTPRYIVFYNGTGNEPDQQELRLSDSFIQQDGSYYLECRATVLNINYGHNKELMVACRKLYEYSFFVAKIREYIKGGLDLKAAMDKGIQDCIDSDILKEFLLKHRGEVKQMILTTYNKELHEKSLIEQGRQLEREQSAQILQREREQNAQILQKHIQSTRQLLLQFLESRWQLPEEILKRVSEETDSDTLAAWASFAIGCDSAKEMEKLILEKGK